MTRPLTIALDGMGGDIGPDVVVPAALRVLETAGDAVRLILVGQEDVLASRLRQANAGSDQRLIVRHASQLVNMDESPAQALRVKKDSSMRVAINLVKQGEADACVSAGNTGALMATSRFVLKTLPGIDRGFIRQQMVQGRSKRKNITSGICMTRIATVLFERCIKCSTLTLKDGNGYFSRCEKLYQTKVDKLNYAVGSNLKVTRLDIAMQDDRVL